MSVVSFFALDVLASSGSRLVQRRGLVDADLLWTGPSGILTADCCPVMRYSEVIFNYIGFEVLTAVSMKIAVFWVVAPCSLVEVYQRRPDDGGSKDL
jgi:hypothetical protein